MWYQVYEVANRDNFDKYRFWWYWVPAICEHPECNEEIDRGVSHACWWEPFSEHWCDRYFCSKHLEWVGINNDWTRLKEDHTDEEYDRADHPSLCERCEKWESPFPYKKETKERVSHILSHESWEERRKENTEMVKDYKKILVEK